MHSCLTKNNVRKNDSRRCINNIRRQKGMTILSYYCKYKCQLQGADGDYWYQVEYIIFYILGPS